MDCHYPSYAFSESSNLPLHADAFNVQGGMEVKEDILTSAFVLIRGDLLLVCSNTGTLPQIVKLAPAINATKDAGIT